MTITEDTDCSAEANIELLFPIDIIVSLLMLLQGCKKMFVIAIVLR